ncbi:MAG: flagellar hook capping protein [Gemmataceae bacterium]|nr:flagellar hook capping protein [Gemmataceae bacterium]
MAVDGVTSTIPLAGAGGARQATPQNDVNALGQNDFLKLLIAQLQNQDPLQPVDNAEFIAQMAQFSTLNAVLQMNTNFANLLTLQGLTQGSSLIGKTVTYSAGDPPRTQEGQVDSIALDKGNVQLVIDGVNVDLNQIQSVTGGT